MAGTSLLPLSTLAGTIKAHIAAGDKAVGKAEEHYKAAGLHLLEAKERVKRTANLTWPAFLIGQCSIQRSRADELIAIAEGRSSLAEVRERTNERKVKHRAATQEQPFRNGKSSEISQEKQRPRIETPERMQVFDRIVVRLKNLDTEALREIEQFITENHNV